MHGYDKLFRELLPSMVKKKLIRIVLCAQFALSR